MNKDLGIQLPNVERLSNLIALLHYDFQSQDSQSYIIDTNAMGKSFYLASLDK